MDKPAVLEACHIRRYHQHVERGLSLMSPEQLNAMLADGRLVVDESGAISASCEMLCPADGLNTDMLPTEEYFNDGHHSDTIFQPPHVSLDVHVVNFGRAGDLNNIENQVVSLTNHTQGKITVVWTGDSSRIFSVTPATADVLPLKACAFRVSFRPNGPNKFFGSELECYAFYKSMRDYRLTDDITHFPPWCVTLTATGSSFQVNNEHFIPRFVMGPNKMSFAVVNEHESSYRTFLLTNTGTTPILFDFEKSSNGIYSTKPTKGLLTPSSNQIFLIKFTPISEKNPYKDVLKLRLNDDDKHTQDVLVYGKVEMPDLLLDNDGVIYLKPTCIGSASQRIYGIKNLSRVPVFFEWKLQHHDLKVLRVDPPYGVILPNERQFQKWYFNPASDEKYVIKPVVSAWAQAQLDRFEDIPKEKKLVCTVRVIGEGSAGLLTCKEDFVECGPLVVGTVTNLRIMFANESCCNLHYNLHVTQYMSGPYGNEHLFQKSLDLELNETEGILPGRTKAEVVVSVKPKKRTTYHWNLSYTILTTDGSIVKSSEERDLCQITATGVYPTLNVSDARCQGSASGLSKKQLWSLFCLDKLNEFLDGDPSDVELKYAYPTKHSMSRKPSICTRAILDFNFSAAPVASEPCVVQLKFDNNGSVPCHWSFLYPTDLQLDMEYWAETGEYSADELHEMKIVENKLFSIEPKTIKLAPGETSTVTFTYRHTMIGTDRLPVLLKLNRGREILLNFVGVTVEADRPYIHFPSTRFMFAPVPIGETRGATQIYDMYNGGALPVKFEIETLPLRAMAQENFGHTILECLNPKGEIQPGHTANIEWMFAPLEARTYSIDLTINIDCGETVMITFTGVGFDKRLLGDTMPITDRLDHSGVPSRQTIINPAQLCYLNWERVSFGNMPLFSRGRRVLVMTNRSKEHCADFTWHVTNDNDAQYITVNPKSGVIPPGESILLKITFLAFGVPAFYDIDLVCEVKNVTEQKSYEYELNKWQCECQRQCVEFTCTEKDPYADLRLTSPVCVREESCQPNCKLDILENGEHVTPESMELLRYKTLPPIVKKPTCDDKRLNEKLQRRFDEKFWPKPVKPKPFLMHLGVTVRTHDIVEFQQHFPYDYKRFFIDRTIFDTSTACSPDELIDNSLPLQPICCNQSEADMLELSLSNIIRNLLDDRHFHEACQMVMDEPVPYFQQFCSRKSVRLRSVHSTESFVKLYIGSISIENKSEMAHEEELEEIGSEEKDLEEVASDEHEVVKHIVSGPGRSSGKVNFTVEMEPGSSSDETHPLGYDAHRNEMEINEFTAQDPEVLQNFSNEMGGQTSEDTDISFIQKLKKIPEVSTEVESALENTLLNILQEAFHLEFNVTARPRLVALPLRPKTPGNTNGPTPQK